MNWNSIVAWTVSLSALSLLVRLMQRPREEEQRGWLVVCLGILGITFAMARLNAPGLGWVSGLLWLVLMAIPLVGLRLVMHWVVSYRLAWAQRLAIALVVLHPADGWFDHIALLRVLRLAQSGQVSAATQLLDTMEKRDRPRLAYLARALFYATLANWAQLRTWVTALPPRLLEHNPHLALLYLRSLAEVGDIDHCLAEGQRLLPALERHGGSSQANYARLLMLAMGGQPDSVVSLSDRASIAPPVERPFWLATAQWTAGQTAIAQATFDRLAADPTTPYSLKQAIIWRKTHPLPQYALAPDSRDRLLADLHHSHYYTLSLGHLRHSRATLGLITLNLAVFALEIWAGGSTNLSTLYQLGALVPQAVANGAGWRLLSAIFLHYGWLHLTMNMTGLAILGPFVETRLGVSRFSLVYLITGVGSMGCVTLAALLQAHTLPQIAVGASGAIMGLLGAVLAIFWEGWQVQRSRLAKQRFYWLLLGVGIQITFDLSTPGISVLGHLSGFVLGSILGWLLVRSPQPFANE